jgi:hypothetical protein
MADSPRLEELRRRVQSDPASIAFAALAEEYRRAGKFREAVEASRAGLRYHPTYVSARVTLGRSLVELQEVEQAERELTFVLKSAPDNLAARRALGELCWQQLRFGDALLHFRTAHTLAPADAELPNILQSLERELAADRKGSNGKAVDVKPEAEAAAKVEVPAKVEAKANVEADADAKVQAETNAKPAEADTQPIERPVKIDTPHTDAQSAKTVPPQAEPMAAPAAEAPAVGVGAQAAQLAGAQAVETDAPETNTAESQAVEAQVVEPRAVEGATPVAETAGGDTPQADMAIEIAEIDTRAAALEARSAYGAALPAEVGVQLTEVEPQPAAAMPAEQAAPPADVATEGATPEHPQSAASEQDASKEAASADVTFEETPFHHTKGEEAEAAASTFVEVEEASTFQEIPFHHTKGEEAAAAATAFVEDASTFQEVEVVAEFEEFEEIEEIEAIAFVGDEPPVSEPAAVVEHHQAADHDEAAEQDALSERRGAAAGHHEAAEFREAASVNGRPHAPNTNTALVRLERFHRAILAAQRRRQAQAPVAAPSAADTPTHGA